MSRIYLDYNATTPMDPEVASFMAQKLAIFGNPASAHQEGQEAEQLLTESREIIAAAIGAQPSEIIFTSGGTESNRTVLHQLDATNPRFRSKLITTPVEHSSIMESLVELQEQGVEVQFVKVDRQGNVDLEHLAHLVDDQSLVSIILANNEIGTIQDADTIARLVKKTGALLHFDATQYVGKFPLTMKDLPADFVTFTAHKMYGPRGIGALYHRTYTPFRPLFVGGGQEDERRAGTANQWLAAGFARALELRLPAMEHEEQHLRELKEFLVHELSFIEGVSFNGRLDEMSIPGTLSMTVEGVENELLLMYLDMAGIAVSTGSACAARSFKPSHVLTALGRAEHEAYRTIRVSMGAQTTKEEMKRFLVEVQAIILKVRARR